MLKDLKILEKQYEFIEWAYPLISKFPVKQRFVLGQLMQNSMLNILTGIITANHEKNKYGTLKQTSIELDKFRYLFRLARKFNFVSSRQYEFGSKQINEVGKMLGGWIKMSIGNRA